MPIALRDAVLGGIENLDGVYAFSVKHLGTGARDVRDVNIAEEAIARVSRNVYDYFTKG